MVAFVTLKRIQFYLLCPENTLSPENSKFRKTTGVKYLGQLIL